MIVGGRYKWQKKITECWRWVCMSVCHSVKTCRLQVYTSLFKTIYSVLEDFSFFHFTDYRCPSRSKRSTICIFFFVFCFSFLFISSTFASALYSTTVLISVFVLAHTHPGAVEKSKWMCSFHILVPLNCMEVITFLINYCKKCFY